MQKAISANITDKNQKHASLYRHLFCYKKNINFVQTAGRKRGRPRKPKVEQGEIVPKVKGPRGRPRKENQSKLKVFFSFEDKYDLSPEEMRKLQMEGSQLPDVVKKRRGRKRKVDSNPGAAADKALLEPKKRGRKKKVEGPEELGKEEKKVRKKRGPNKKKLLEMPGGWCVTKRRRAYRTRTLGEIGKELVENTARYGTEAPVTVSDAFNGNGKESTGDWAMKFWQTLLYYSTPGAGLMSED